MTGLREKRLSVNMYKEKDAIGYHTEYIMAWIIQEVRVSPD